MQASATRVRVDILGAIAVVNVVQGAGLAEGRMGSGFR